MINWIKNFYNEEDGAGLAEYALLLVLIAVVCIVTLTPMGEAIAAVFSYITGILGPIAGGA
jgi:Flp pilus assembly pilin Flp